MCGIAGVIGLGAPEERRISLTLELMGRRGPDAQGVYHGTLRDSDVCLLHTRLSIIDLDPRADQPFEEDGCILVFNGEIYNYVELRSELAALGHRFRTESDTEVIVQAWRRWGRSCVDRFEGMWAIALFDQRSDELFLSRDRFGEKPLFHMRYAGKLYFASEVKFLAALSGHKPSVNTDQVRRYLVNGYKAIYKEPRTYFTEVAELPPSSWAVLTGPEEPQAHSYWELHYRPREMSRGEAIAGARDRLIEALRIRLRADVPVAFCLSGGIDSGALAALAVKHFDHRVHAFSIIDRDPRYNELENIQSTVSRLGCDLHTIETTMEGFIPRLEQLVAYHDAPVATISYYVHSFLSQAIAEAGYKVAFSGTAADELFTGYYDHYGMWLAEIQAHPDFQIGLDAWSSSYGRFVRNPFLKDPLAFVHDPSRRDHIFLNAELFQTFMRSPFDEAFTETPYADSVLRSRMLNELWHESVPVILREDDLNSMMYSVENRSPFLDRGLAEFMYTVPSEHLIHDGYVKSILREAVAELLPDAVRLDKRKRGFNTSIDSLVDRSDPGTIEFLLADGPIFDIVKRDKIEKFIAGDMTDNSFSKFLFSFISARIFLDHHRAWAP